MTEKELLQEKVYSINELLSTYRELESIHFKNIASSAERMSLDEILSETKSILKLRGKYDVLYKLRKEYYDKYVSL